MLIAATAVLVTIAPVLKRTSRGARPPEPRVSRGPEHSEGSLLLPEDAVERDEAPPGTPDGPVRGPWGAQRSVFARWGRDRPAEPERNAGGLADDYEVEQMVREKLYGRRARQR